MYLSISWHFLFQISRINNIYTHNNNDATLNRGGPVPEKIHHHSQKSESVGFPTQMTLPWLLSPETPSRVTDSLPSQIANSSRSKSDLASMIFLPKFSFGGSSGPVQWSGPVPVARWPGGQGTWARCPGHLATRRISARSSSRHRHDVTRRDCRPDRELGDHHISNPMIRVIPEPCRRARATWSKHLEHWFPAMRWFGGRVPSPGTRISSCRPDAAGRQHDIPVLARPGPARHVKSFPRLGVIIASIGRDSVVRERLGSDGARLINCRRQHRPITDESEVAQRARGRKRSNNNNCLPTNTT